MERGKNIYKNRCMILVILFFIILSNTIIASASQITVKTNRYVVLDDPNGPSIASSGFFTPTDVIGGNWGTSYWSGESTTIRATALVTDDNGSPISGVNVNFNLRYPNNTVLSTASSLNTDDRGIAYYSFNLNERKYWGYWKISASANVGGTNIQNNASFVLNWWGCAQCHGSQDPGKWGTKYTPKSYYTMGYDFHRSQQKTKHTEAMADGACIICHQSYNGTAVDWNFNDNTPPINPDNEYSPDWHYGKKKCQDCHAGSNISLTPQGKNPEIAGCYDTTGCHTKKNAILEKVNSTTGYIIGGNYRTNYSDIQNSNVAKAHNDSRVECIVCHGAGHNITKPYNVSSTSNTYTENDQCWICHTNRLTSHMENTNCVSCHTQNAHKISLGGGPDCISCHNIGGSATHEVDANAIALGVHANINSLAISDGIPVENKKCWACHQTGGVQPTGMGDRYRNPYKCYDCHGVTKPYSNVEGAPTVEEHFKSGTDIKAVMSAANDSASCLVCHNVAEMKVSYTETDGLNNEGSLASHYGKNRNDLRVAGGTITDCRYCHQNTSTVFLMSNIENNNMANHTTSLSTPMCTDCHGVGKIHDFGLNKPISDDNLCKSCHVSKNEHKTLYCTECHANSPGNGNIAGRDIHGIKYLQKDNTFSTGKTNVVDCTTCHQSNVVDSSIIMTIIKISDQLHHSDDINNGSKWGNYWTSPIEACIYCHNDTKHSATPLGRPLEWNPSYVLNTPIGSGTNCGDCHYDGFPRYDTMKGVYVSIGREIPPEITNGSWNGKGGYFNHTLSDYTDSQCKLCHDAGGSTTVGQLVHSVTIGGDNCIACHQNDVNISKFGRHAKLNESDGPGVVSNADCTTCHYNKDMNRANVYLCNSCHTDGNGVIKVNDPTLWVPDVSHGQQTCKSCHAPVKYHMNGAVGPKGFMELFSFK